MLTIGEFSRASRLSPKALRLYDELGLLPPASTDPHTGYRHYDLGQLERARLINWLRRLGMPLAEIRTICALPPGPAAKAVGDYWHRVESENALRRELADFLVGHLSGREPAIFTVATRDVPERTLLSVQRHLTTAELAVFATDLVIRIGDGTVPAVPGIAGAPFLVYYGEVDDDNDGPVEFCRAVPAESAQEIAGRFPDLVLRREPAHREIYVRLTKARLGPVDALRACRALEEWAAERHETPVGAIRTIFFADVSRAGDDDPVMDVAGTLRSPE